MRWLLLAVVLLVPSAALAQPARTIVLTFAGPGADRARDAVISSLAPEVQLVPEENAIAAAEQLGVDLGSAEGFAALLDHLDVTLVVAGEVAGRGRNATTTIMVMDAAGSELARRSAPGPSGAGIDAIGAAAIEAVDEAELVLHRHPGEDTPPPPPDTQPIAAPEPEPEPEPPVIGWRNRQLLLLAGIRLRTVGTFVTDDTGNTHFFTADMYPEIELDLTFRPWFAAESDMRGLMFGVRGAFSVGMAYLDPAGTPLGMTSYRFQLDIGYAYTIADLVEIVGIGGLGVDGVSLDQPLAFPSTTFTYLRFMLATRVRVVPDFLIAEGGIGARIGLDAGPLASAYGPSLYYGGLEVFIGVSGSVDPGFAWSVRAGYQLHALEVEGLMGLYANGVGGNDEAIELRLLVGWTF
jgi:hypothetical protein